MRLAMLKSMPRAYGETSSMLLNAVSSRQVLIDQSSIASCNGCNRSVVSDRQATTARRMASGHFTTSSVLYHQIELMFGGSCMAARNEATLLAPCQCRKPAGVFLSTRTLPLRGRSLGSTRSSLSLPVDTFPGDRTRKE